MIVKMNPEDQQTVITRQSNGHSLVTPTKEDFGPNYMMLNNYILPDPLWVCDPGGN